MNEPTNVQLEVRPSPEPNVYEQLYLKLLAYRFGSISFLELLDAFEEILHVQTAHSNPRSDAA